MWCKKAAVLMNRRFFQLDLLALIGSVQERHDLRARAVRVGAKRRGRSAVRHVARNRPIDGVSVERVGLHIGEVSAALDLLTKGTVNASLIAPREIFIQALKAGAVSIVLVHNHPSGDDTPSREALAATEKVRSAGELIGIRLIDHIIIGSGHFTSLCGSWNH